MVSVGEDSQNFGQCTKSTQKVVRVSRSLLKNEGLQYIPRDSVWEVRPSREICLFHSNPDGSDADGSQTTLENTGVRATRRA